MNVLELHSQFRYYSAIHSQSMGSQHTISQHTIPTPRSSQTLQTSSSPIQSNSSLRSQSLRPFLLGGLLLPSLLLPLRPPLARCGGVSDLLPPPPLLTGLLDLERETLLLELALLPLLRGGDRERDGEGEILIERLAGRPRRGGEREREGEREGEREEV